MDNKSEKLKNIICERYGSIREFSKIVEIPSTTLTSALDKGIGGMAVDRVIKICNELNLDIKTFESLENPQQLLSDNKEIIQDTPKLSISKKEQILLLNYRGLNDTGREKLLEHSEDLVVNPKYMIKNNKCELSATLDTVDYLMPIAAHADDEDDLDLLRQDLDEL